MNDIAQYYGSYNRKAITLFVELILIVCRYERTKPETSRSTDEVLREPNVKSLNGHSILGCVIKLELDQVLESGPFQVN